MCSNFNLVLGTSSPFRERLMLEAALPCEVIAPDIDEKEIRDDDPEVLVMKLGKAKSLKVAEILNGRPNDLIITSDQVLGVRIDRPTVSDEEIANPELTQMWAILEKPLDPFGKPNKNLLRRYFDYYAEKPITAFTSLVIYNSNTQQRLSHIDTVQLFLSPFADYELDEILVDPMSYQAAGGIATGIPGSSASYIIGRHIVRMIGDKSGLIGLPMRQLQNTLTALGYQRPGKMASLAGYGK